MVLTHRVDGRRSAARQVLCLIAAGRPPREIAAELNVSAKTVATHRPVYWRRWLKNNAEVVQYAIEHDLLPGRRSERSISRSAG
jgi:FixJ family two-component response regulator